MTGDAPQGVVFGFRIMTRSAFGEVLHDHSADVMAADQQGAGDTQRVEEPQRAFRQRRNGSLVTHESVVRQAEAREIQCEDLMTGRRYGAFR